MINRWTDDRQGHISRSEILRIVDFYAALVGSEFKEVCDDIKNKISSMSVEEWDECADRIPFEVPYTSEAIVENPDGAVFKNLSEYDNWNEERQWGNEVE